MTTTPAPTACRRHTDVVTGHAYAIPIVRELPRPAVDPVAAGEW